MQAKAVRLSIVIFMPLSQWDRLSSHRFMLLRVKGQHLGLRRNFLKLLGSKFALNVSCAAAKI